MLLFCLFKVCFSGLQIQIFQLKYQFQVIPVQFNKIHCFGGCMEVLETVTFEFAYPTPLNKPRRCKTLTSVYIFRLVNDKEQQKQIDELKPLLKNTEAIIKNRLII